METNRASLAAALLGPCYAGDFMLSLSDENQADIIDTLNSTSRHLDDLLNIDKLIFFNKWLIRSIPLTFSKANYTNTKTPFWIDFIDTYWVNSSIDLRQT